MNDVDDRVGRYLHQRAHTIELEPGSLDRVARRAQQRRGRRRLAGVVAVGLAAVLVADQVTSSGSDPTVTMAPASGGVAQGAALQWERRDPSDPSLALGHTMQMVNSGRALYALSTAPGRAGADQSVPQALYRSADGVEWQAASLLEDGVWLGDLETDGRRLYAVGTAAATTAGGSSGSAPLHQLLVGTSDDGGAQWAKQALPVDLAALEAQTTSLWVTSTSVASGPNGIVAAARVMGQLDPAVVLPDGVEAPWGIGATPEGVEVYGPPAEGAAFAERSCSTGTVVPVSAEELQARAGAERRLRDEAAGASGAAGRAPEVADGGSGYGCMLVDGDVHVLAKEEVHGPAVQRFTWEELGASDDLRLAALGRLRAFWSADGSDFTEVALPDDVPAGLAAAHVLGGEGGYTLLTHGEPGGAAQDVTLQVLTSPDGQTWTPAGVAPVQGWLSGAGRLGDELVAVVSGVDGMPVLLRSVDGVSWTTLDLGEAFDQERFGSVEGLGTGPLALSPDGMALVLFELTEDGIGRQYVLSTVDGETWTTTALDEVPGVPELGVGGGYVRSVGMKGSSVVVTFGVMGPDRDRSELEPTAVLVGTPPAA